MLMHMDGYYSRGEHFINFIISTKKSKYTHIKHVLEVFSSRKMLHNEQVFHVSEYHATEYLMRKHLHLRALKAILIYLNEAVEGSTYLISKASLT